MSLTYIYEGTFECVNMQHAFLFHGQIAFKSLLLVALFNPLLNA